MMSNVPPQNRAPVMDFSTPTQWNGHAGVADLSQLFRICKQRTITSFSHDELIASDLRDAPEGWIVALVKRGEC